MRIALFSKVLYPSVGGIEEVARLLHQAFLQRGTDCTLLTETARSLVGDSPLDESRVFQIESFLQLTHRIRQCDLTLLMGPSVPALLAAAMVGCPTVVSHHNLEAAAARGMRQYTGELARRCLCHRVRHVFASNFLMRRSQYPGEVVPNPYDHRTYYRPLITNPGRDVAFVGRLIRDKGSAHIAPFLATLESIAGPIKFTIIGDGPERRHLESELSVAASEVVFKGALRPLEVAGSLGQHKVAIIPSTCEEAFGLVALEAIAAGCVPVVFDRGGLSEAVGPCGVIVPPFDTYAMAKIVSSLLSEPYRRQQMLTKRDSHLKHHEPAEVGSVWLKALRRFISKEETS